MSEKIINAQMADDVQKEHSHIPIETNDGRLNLSTGRVISFVNPQPDQIHINDIIIGLSRLVRFNGQTRLPLTVAQHSMMAAELADKYGRKMQLSMLLHDAHEAYMGDINSPLKKLLGPKVKQIEKALDQAIEQALCVDLSSPEFQTVKKEIDSMLLHIEYNTLHYVSKENKRPGDSHRFISIVECLLGRIGNNVQIHAVFSEATAAELFLKFYNELKP